MGAVAVAVPAADLVPLLRRWYKAHRSISLNVDNKPATFQLTTCKGGDALMLRAFAHPFCILREPVQSVFCIIGIGSLWRADLRW